MLPTWTEIVVTLSGKGPERLGRTTGEDLCQEIAVRVAELLRSGASLFPAVDLLIRLVTVNVAVRRMTSKASQTDAVGSRAQWLLLLPDLTNTPTALAGSTIAAARVSYPTGPLRLVIALA